MKKALSIVLTLLMVLSVFTACGNSKKEPTTTAQQTTETESSESTTKAESTETKESTEETTEATTEDTKTYKAATPASLDYSASPLVGDWFCYNIENNGEYMGEVGFMTYTKYYNFGVRPDNKVYGGLFKMVFGEEEPGTLDNPPFTADAKNGTVKFGGLADNRYDITVTYSFGHTDTSKCYEDKSVSNLLASFENNLLELHFKGTYKDDAVQHLTVDFTAYYELDAWYMGDYFAYDMMGDWTDSHNNTWSFDRDDQNWTIEMTDENGKEYEGKLDIVARAEGYIMQLSMDDISSIAGTMEFSPNKITIHQSTSDYVLSR